MKKDDIQRMLSQVDEKYISEMTETEFSADSEMDYSAEVSGEVEVVKHISHWRNWAAAAAALIVCVGLGVALIRPAMQRSQFQVGDSAGCYDFIDSLTEEEFDKYFLNQIENLPDFPLTKIADSLPIENISPVIGKNLIDNMNLIFSESHDFAELQMMNTGTGAVIARVWDNAPELDFSQAQAYHIDEYDVDFYGVYGQAVSEPMPYSQSFFSYHGRMYHLYTDTLSKKETIRLVYEILDSEFSAKQLYLEYGMSDEDFVPYFINTEDNEDDTLGNLNGSEAFSERYGKFTTRVENIAPAVAKNRFDLIDIAFNDISYSDRKAELQMNGGNYSAVVRVYDNQELPEQLSQMTLCHLDDYDIDFYGIYRSQDTEMSHCIFAYHDKLYEIYTDNFSRKETVKLAYEVLESDISAESLYQQYCGDIVSIEDSRITTLEEANQLEFCKGLVPQLDTLQGENEKINGRNLGMDGEYIYDNLYTLYDDSDLHLDENSLNYYQNDLGQKLSYRYSNSDCILYISYTSVLPDGANLAEYYSPKITLNEPFSTLAENQDENSRLRNWDFWLDLDTCYVHLDGHCSMNQEDAFINGLNNILVSQQQDIQENQSPLVTINQTELCRNLVPQMNEVGDMHFDKAITALTETDPIKSVEIQYTDDTMTKGFTVNYSDMNLDLIDISVPVLTADQITEEGLENAGIFTEYQGFFIDCQKCLIDISFTNCTKEEMMPYLTELKNLIEKYDSENTDLQEFSQSTSYPWSGLVPELQKIGSLEFESIETPYVNMLPTADSSVQGNKAYYDYIVHYRDPNVEGHELDICYTPDDSQYIFTTVSADLGIIQEVPLYGGDGSERAFELHTGTFGIYINAVGCTQEEIDLYLNETEKLLKQNPQIYDEIVKYLNQQEDFKNCIPEISGINNMKLGLVMTNLTLDENAPRIHIAYVDEENVERKLHCVFKKASSIPSEATTLTIEEIDGNLQIESGQYEHFELLIDCHGWYAWIVGENCYKEDLDCYTMALAETYKANH